MKINQDQWPQCAQHSQNTYQLLLLSPKSSSSRILCTECLYSKQSAKFKDDYAHTIPLSIALQSPDIMIDQMINNKGNKNFKGLFTICELELDKLFNEQIAKFELLNQIFLQMKDQITQKLKDYKEIQGQLKKVKETFFEKCHCNLLHRLIDQLKELDIQSKSDQYKQIVGKINITIEEMLKDNCSLITKNTNEVLEGLKQMKLKKVKPNNDQIVSSITQVFQEYQDFIEELNGNMNKSQSPHLLTNQFYKSVQQKIEQGSKKQIKKINPIYLGTRDGLNGKAYWSKVNGKKNLLIIMKSQINQVFGAYSPCQWKSSSGGKYVQDDTLTSFIFSYTKNQIYPLNQTNKACAIYCQSSYGPTFGGGHDINISTDFNSGSSNLGHTYILDQQYMTSKNTHLFDEFSTKIIECEVYEIILS